MKRLATYILCILFCVPLCAQTESCVRVVNELVKNADAWDDQTGIDYVLSHKDAFNMHNDVDVWLYNLALGTRYYPLGKYAEALPYLREVTAICDTRGHEMNLASNPQLLVAYYWEANCEFHTHAPKDVFISKLRRAKTVFEKYGQKKSDTYKAILSDIETLQSGSLDNLHIMQTAIQYVMTGNHKEAIPLLERIIDQWPSSRPVRELAAFMQCLGNSYIEVGKLNEAENLYLKALNMLDKNKERGVDTYRYICDALGVLYCQVYNYEKAKYYTSLSKQLHEEYMDFSVTYIRSLSNCALAESGLNHPFVAKLLMDVALHYMRKGIGNKTAESIVGNLSSLQSITGVEFRNDFFNQVSQTFQSRPYIRLLSNAAMINQQAGFWEDAVMCIKESIALSEKIGEPVGLIYNNLATLYLAQSRVDESLLYFEKASALCQTDYEKNEVWFNYALALWLAHSKQCVNVAIKVSENLTQSIAYNFAFLSQEERTIFYNHFEYYLPIINLILYESGDEKQYGYIYNNILTTKGLLLRTANGIKNTILESGTSQMINDYNRMVSLRQQMLNEKDSIEHVKLNKEAELLDKALSRSAASYGVFATNSAIKWENIRNNLKDNEIAIEFYNIPIAYPSDTIQKINGGPRYCAVILKQNSRNPHIIPLCKENELEDLDIDLLYNDSLLYKLIWKPMEKELVGVKNIYFAADRELHKIAVEYALTPEGNRMNDIYNLFRLSSTRVLAEQQNKASTNNAVLFGGLRYDLESDQLIAESRSSGLKTIKAARSAGFDNFRYGVEYRPGTKEEVEEIYQDYQLTKKAHCKLITDIAGTEAAFKNLVGQDVGVIHLATHGFFWTEEEAEKRSYVSFLANPMQQDSFEDTALMRSGLFFSGANIGLAGEQLPDDVEDGILTAQELSSMNLGNVDMVVMSACQSGLGETSGEGVFGLQRGFKLAGANTLLMSLWKVDDEATKILMTEFYKKYLAGESKHDALHLGQLKLRSNPEFSDPEYWAAFILLDDLN